MLSLPTLPLCREDCRGLCARCGADLNADQISVGGDVTGRDKIIQIKAEAGATVYIGQTGPAPVQIDDDAALPAE